MKKLSLTLLLCLAMCIGGSSASAQVYAKLNGLYALVGVVNPAFEITLSKKSTFQTELVYSPWNSINIKGVESPMKFLIFLNDYRYYFKEHNNGWYGEANAGMMAFNMTKPYFRDGKVHFKQTSGKGYGFMLGVSVGYEWILNDRWLLDAYFGWAWMNSHYNPYALVDGVVEGGHVYNKGECILTPGQGTVNKLDPFNGSGEWLPNKIGVSIGFLIFDPHKKDKKSSL